MGCGSVLGDLFHLTDALLDRAPRGGWGVERGVWSMERPSTLHASRSPREGIRAQLYNMYGKGEISEEVFIALRALADRGQLRPADLAVHRARASRRPAHRADVNVQNALRGIRSRLARLAQARAASAKVLADLDARLNGLDERMTDKTHAARQAVGHDEDAARQRLAEKVELTASHDRLATQAQALRDDLARLDDLYAQLEASAAELEAVRARGELAEDVKREFTHHVRR